MADHGSQQKRAAHRDMKQENQFTARIALSPGHVVDPGSGADKGNIIHWVYHQTNIWVWQGYRKSEKNDEVNIQPDYRDEVLIGNKHIKTWFGRPQAGLTKTKTVSEYKYNLKEKTGHPSPGFLFYLFGAISHTSPWLTKI